VIPSCLESIKYFSAILFSLFLCLILAQAQESSRQVRLKFAGNQAVSEGDLVTFTEKCFGDSATYDQKIKALDYCVLRNKYLLFSRGHLQAKIGEPTLTRVEDGMQVTVPVEEGALYRLGTVRIDGASVFSSAFLREMLPLKEGEVVDGGVIEEWVNDRVKDAYAERGYIQYTGEIEPKFHLTDNATEGSADLTVTIDEGKRFVVNLIQCECDTNIPTENVLGLLNMRIGEPFSRASLKAGINSLNELALFEMIDVDKDVEYRVNEENSEVRLIIHLKRKTKAER
jgi:outer membrane protein insertion porin family